MIVGQDSKPVACLRLQRAWGVSSPACTVRGEDGEHGRVLRVCRPAVVDDAEHLETLESEAMELASEALASSLGHHRKVEQGATGEVGREHLRKHDPDLSFIVADQKPLCRVEGVARPHFHLSQIREGRLRRRRFERVPGARLENFGGEDVVTEVSQGLTFPRKEMFHAQTGEILSDVDLRSLHPVHNARCVPVIQRISPRPPWFRLGLRVRASLGHPVMPTRLGASGRACARLLQG